MPALPPFVVGGLPLPSPPDLPGPKAATPTRVERPLGGLRVFFDAVAPPEADALDDEWHQRCLGLPPLWGGSLTGLTRRLSIENCRAGLVLFGRHDLRGLPDMLRGLGVTQTRFYTVRALTSASPLCDGFLTCLRFAHCGDEIQVAGKADAMAAFAEEELACYGGGDGQDLEEHLRRVYRDAPAEVLGQRLFQTVDYPTFDNGVLHLGFGVLAENDLTYRIWSRPVHSHK